MSDSYAKALDELRDLAARPWQPIRLSEPVDPCELPTPALVLDAAAMERNLERVVSLLKSRGLGYRPHAKTHKCAVIAHRLLERGACGICCAKVAEAEALGRAGIDRALITSPIATSSSAQRVARLAHQASQGRSAEDEAVSTVQVVVDCAAGASLLDDAMVRLSVASSQLKLGVLIDLDVGTHRTGVQPDDAAALAAKIEATERLELRGVQAYAGHLMHRGDFDERRERSQEAMTLAVATAEALRSEGHDIAIVTGGGTGTYDIDSQIDGITDLQVGSFLFMDSEYCDIERDPSVPQLEQALHVHATAISQPVPHLITVDSGYKALASDSVKPRLTDIEGVVFHWGGDEHGILQLKEPSRPLAVGDNLRITPPHCDPTVNLYDAYWVLDDGLVRELWPIVARGASW